MTDAMDADRTMDRTGDDAQDPVLTDPGSKTQPAEGGRDEADDGGSTGAGGDQDAMSDDAGG